MALCGNASPDTALTVHASGWERMGADEMDGSGWERDQLLAGMRGTMEGARAKTG
jgi:hypothetical protein